MSYIYEAPVKARNLTYIYIYLGDIFTWDFVSWTVHFINICMKTNKYTNCSFSLLIMYGSSYKFQYYIAIFREHS
jgi:hypothetical protein